MKFRSLAFSAAACAAIFATPGAVAGSCGDRMVECYTSVYRSCGGLDAEDTDPCVIEGLSACRQSVECGTEPPRHCEGCEDSAGRIRRERDAGENTRRRRYDISLGVRFASNCTRYRRLLEREISRAVDRFEDCLNYGFVKRPLADRMVRALEDSPGAIVRCQEPPRSSWCAAGGLGEVWFSPRKALASGSICRPDLGSYFIHEIGHVAGLRAGAGHNERGETGRFDEIYSLQNYCMRPARMWIKRAERTGDVVDSEYLSCMRRYQERTPSTLQDPFWDAFRERVDAGRPPCP